MKTLAERRGTGPDPVNQDERMAAVGAAHENAARRAITAAGVELDTRLAAENVAEGGLAGLGQFLAFNHGHIGEQLRGAHRLACRGDHDGVETGDEYWGFSL
jgi:hypothetical protein